jgi:hypothetical protein
MFGKTEAEMPKCASSSIPYVFDDLDKLAEVKSLINNIILMGKLDPQQSPHIYQEQPV